jgi:predicted ABC-class ATPase
MNGMRGDGARYAGPCVPAAGSAEDLRGRLHGLEGRGYRAYKAIEGCYRFARFELVVDHAQGDPFADASRVRAIVAPETARLPAALLGTPRRRVSVADFLTRALHGSLRERSRSRGSGRSGELSVLRPGQEVLARTAMLVHPDGTVEARFRAGLPADGRTILGAEAAAMLCDDVPAAVEASLLHAALDAGALRRHVETVEDAQALRAELAGRGLVAFVGDGARLPRRSGVDDAPLDTDAVLPFEAPAGLRVTLSAPNAGALTGMGVPEGVTLLVGGGFHGKSTLLRALERGVYDHVPGDGRERVVTRADAVKVRAEDGRQVTGADISNFIGMLPGGVGTRSFHTENASGSTSQAAAIVEALEVGCGCLLLDEDTSATNFLIRDARVQALIAREHEPITPFIDRVRTMHRELGISTVLVVGGAGDYFDVADTVIALRDYRPLEVTADARAVAARHPTARRAEAAAWRPLAARVPLPGSIDPRRGRHPVEVQARVASQLRFGEADVDLAGVEQIVEAAQTRAIGRALAWGRHRAIDGEAGMAEALGALHRALEAEGLDALDERIVGDYAEFRVFELAAALGRLRTLRVRA